MFTPENFYDVINENYATPTGSIQMVTKEHGYKNLFDFIPFKGNPAFSHDMNTNFRFKINLSYLYMHDQEPLFASSIDTYKRVIRESIESDLHDALDDIPFAAIWSYKTRSLSIPIFCTSELVNDEIRSMSEHLFVPCYYWYHAFIARDWFRHWQYNVSLRIYNKSAAPNRFLLYCRDTTGTRTYRKTVLDRLQTITPSVSYGMKNAEKPSILSAYIDTEDAQTSAVHLVAETLFDVPKTYLTEKVFKPIVMSQPFIIFGPPGTLEYLRRYGFETFSSLWSEEYDREADHDQRLEKIMDLIRWMAEIPPQEFHELYEKCLPIIEHNRRRFFSHDFMDHCWQEVSQNFTGAYQQRQNLLEEYPGGQIMYTLAVDPHLVKLPTARALCRQIFKTLDDGTKSRVLTKYPRFNEL